MMNLFARDGSAKLVPRCSDPLTGQHCVDRVYTDHGIVRIDADGVTLEQVFGATFDDLVARLAPLPVRRAGRAGRAFAPEASRG